MARIGVPLAGFVLGVLLAASLAGPAGAQANCQDTIDGRVCTVQQPLVAGALVPADLQRALGLVTVAGGCSGTLVNRYWVLTADHCITTNASVGGPEADPPSSIQVTAAWSAAAPTATKFVRFGPSHSLDVALIFLGNGDFGDVNRQLFFVGEVEAGMTLTKYGRGISAYATGSGPTAVPAVNDGRYRSARFTASSGSATTYRLPVNAAGQVGNGGDSGGPDIVTSPDGIGVGIAGVQSTCGATGYVPGMPTNWNWATGVSACSSAALETIRFEILQAIQEEPGQFIGTFGTTPANFSPVFLYAATNDGSLLWYRQDSASAAWSGPRQVGIGWRYRDIIPAGGNSLYALTQDGRLLWFRHDGFNDGSFTWTGPTQVGTSWTFAKVFSGSDGVVYGINAAGDLFWYRNAGFADGTASWSGPVQVGNSWAGFKDVFSAGDGVIYAVRYNGELLWYRHNGYLNGAYNWAGPYVVGSGWQTFQDIIPAGNGVLLAVAPDGTLNWYRHTDYLEGVSVGGSAGGIFSGASITSRAHWEGPVVIGNGWDGFRQLTAILPSAPPVVR